MAVPVLMRRQVAALVTLLFAAALLEPYDHNPVLAQYAERIGAHSRPRSGPPYGRGRGLAVLARPVEPGRGAAAQE